MCHVSFLKRSGKGQFNKYQWASNFENVARLIFLPSLFLFLFPLTLPLPPSLAL